MKLEVTMKTGVVILRGLMLPLAMIASSSVRAAWIEDEIPANAITVLASSEYGPGQPVRHLVDGSGMQNGLHDNSGGAETMWHSTERPAPTSAAAGLPASPAWVRFDFAQPQKFDSIRIWNHNQANLTNRGFHRTRIYGSADGASWFALTSPEVTELPRASGSPGLEAVVIANAAKTRALKSVVIAAEPKDGNYGSDYFGLSAVRFSLGREVAEADLPVPTAMDCAALPYCPYRPDGQPGREIAVSLRGVKLYGAVTFDVECAGAKEQTTVPAIARGADHFSILLPAGASATNECEAIVELHSGRAALKQEVSVPACKPRVYYVLMHSHCDIGYTDIQPHIAAKQAQNVVHALELIEETKDYPPAAQFKWNTEVFWQVEQFYKIATPEQKQKFEQAVREHRIGLDAMYGNLLTGLARGEELLRQMEFATDLGRRCGVKVDSMMISDVPGLTWGIVPSLAQAGVSYISDGPNASSGMVGDRIGYVRVQWENHPFAWVSPSGKERVIYWGAQGGYSIGHHCASIRDAIAELTTQLEEWGYPYDIVQLRWTKGDNGGPDETVMPAVRDWNAKYAWPKLIISTTSEMFHEFAKRYGDTLPVYRGDMTPYWEDGAGSSARETGLNRLASDRMTQGEILWTLLKPGALPADGYAEALKNIAMYSEHTWGAYNSISAPDSDFVKAQWKIKQAFALDGESETKKLLAGALATRGPAPETATAIDVFNTASWPRSDLVTLPKTMKLAGDIVKNDQGEVVPSQRLAGGELVFLAKDVPPFGGRRFAVEAGSAASSGAARAEGATLADSTITLKLDERSGAIASLRANGVDHEFVNAATNLGLNEYIYLPGGNVKDAQRNGSVTISVKENGPLVVSLLVESDAPGCNKLRREIRLVEGLDRVEIIDMIDKKAIRSVEGVHIGFGFNISDPALRINIPWGVIQPEKDQLPGACKNWFVVERWVDISNDKLGVTWSTVEAPLLEVGGLTANIPRSQPNPKAYLSKIRVSPTIYSWVMNNHWHTNYRADQEGETVFRYAIRPHTAYDQTAAARFGVESTEPLIAAPAAGPAPSGPLVEISSGPIMITSFKPSSDGRALILRLYNTGETAAQASLKWNTVTPNEISVSDLSELPIGRAGGAIDMAEYEVRTLRAELK
jgi:alpha-mannosidase